MQLIKLAFISIFFLFFVATAISFFIPSEIRISKAINIHGQSDSVLARVADTTRWKEWHPAYIPGDSAKKFPAISIATRSRTDTSLIMEMRQGKKTPVINGFQVYHPIADSLTLQWYMDFKIKWYPWQKFGSMFYEGTYGLMMQQGLENLKRQTEASSRL